MTGHPVTLPDLLARARRFLFFTGKGGVGKTSLSCATAVALAGQGRRVLLISTDPASNLSEVLGATVGSAPAPHPRRPSLWALNIDPEQAARDYRESVLAPYRATLPPVMVAGIEEQLSGACTTEIAAFNEFSRYLGDDRRTREYDHVIFDTAPTGHTLRLLQLPAAWNHFIDTNTSGTSCLGPLSGLTAHKDLYARTLAALSDRDQTQLVLVSRPDRAALAEADRSRGELQAIGLRNIHLVLNGLFRAESRDPVAAAMTARQRHALEAMPAGLRALPFSEIELRSFNVNGVDALSMLMSESAGQQEADPDPVADQEADGPGAAWPGLADLVREMEAQGSGVILTMGKGGVGKTTLASAIAVALAARGHRVHLTTTDPAAHIHHTLGGTTKRLDVGRIDPAEETAAYAREVMATVGAGLDDDGRKLLEEDLRSPCTEEIAVFRAFAARVARGQDQFVVLDTAPTGHTLLLLDATEAYHREVSRNQSELPDSVRQLLPRLRDPSYSRILIVTLPEFTPVHEAMALQADLRRAGIEPYGWVVNQSLTPLDVTDPLLRARKSGEAPHLRAVASTTPRYAVMPWQVVEPVGIEALLSLSQPVTPMELPT